MFPRENSEIYVNYILNVCLTSPIYDKGSF